LTDQAHGHLPEGLNAVGVAPIVRNGYFFSACAIIDNFLLIVQIAQIGGHNRTKFVVGSSTLGHRQRVESEHDSD
jgi:hypothetical protein